MHPTRIRNILWMLKRNGFKTEIASTNDTDDCPRHTITATSDEGQRWSVTGDDIDSIVAALLQQLGSKGIQDDE